MSESAADGALVYEAHLGPEELGRLLGELSGREDVEVRLRRVGERAARPERARLEDVPGHLRQGCAVQLRYRHEGHGWCDTLRPVASGCELVRARLPE